MGYTVPYCVKTGRRIVEKILKKLNPFLLCCVRIILEVQLLVGMYQPKTMRDKYYESTICLDILFLRTFYLNPT